MLLAISNLDDVRERVRQTRRKPNSHFVTPCYKTRRMLLIIVATNLIINTIINPSPPSFAIRRGLLRISRTFIKFDISTHNFNISLTQTENKRDIFFIRFLRCVLGVYLI